MVVGSRHMCRHINGSIGVLFSIILLYKPWLDGVPNGKPQKRKCMFQKIIFVLFVLFLLGCTKEEIIEKEVEKQYQWQRQAGLDFDNAVLANGYATKDHFFAMGYTQFISLVKDGLSHPDASNGSNLAIYPSQTRLMSTVQFPITGHYHAYTHPSDSTVAIVPNANPTTPGTTKYLRMPEIDPAFRGFDYAPPYFALSMVINQANQLLIPYQGDTGSNLRLLLVEVLQQAQEGATTMDVGQTKIIEIPFKDGIFHVHLGHLTAVNNHFYFSHHDTYRVDANGELSTVLEGVSLTSFIPVGNTIYGLSFWNKLYESTDEGKTWRQIEEDIRLPNSVIMQYTTIAGRHIAYSSVLGEVYEVNLLPSGVTFRELENGGIKRKRITSITEFQGRVYATTLSGLYSCEVERFFESKTEDL